VLIHNIEREFGRAMRLAAAIVELRIDPEAVSPQRLGIPAHTVELSGALPAHCHRRETGNRAATVRHAPRESEGWKDAADTNTAPHDPLLKTGRTMRWCASKMRAKGARTGQRRDTSAALNGPPGSRTAAVACLWTGMV